MSFPNPSPGVIHWITVTGRQAASAAKAKTSSTPNELCMMADSVRTPIETRAMTPATMPVVDMMLERSRIGVPDIVEVTFTAAIMGFELAKRTQAFQSGFIKSVPFEKAQLLVGFSRSDISKWGSRKVTVAVSALVEGTIE